MFYSQMTLHIYLTRCQFKLLDCKVEDRYCDPPNHLESHTHRQLPIPEGLSPRQT